MTITETASTDQATLIRFLSQRYGDGQVYLKDPRDRALLRLSIRLGLISEEGYVTAYGRRFWAANSSSPSGVRATA
jgi:hypothetical protein